MPADETSERIAGPTPNGGAYSVANYLDADRNPCPKSEAALIEILEFDEDGDSIFQTWRRGD